MVIEHAPLHDSVYYAYFEPYSWERHLALLGRVDASPRCAGRRPGHHGGGPRSRTSSPWARRATARSRCGSLPASIPGETMAEWFVEGMLDRLLDVSDPVARALAARAVLHIVPNMNPGRQRARQPAHQRGRRQSQPGVDGAVAGAQPGSAFTFARRCRRPASTAFSTSTATRACPTCSPMATSAWRTIRRAWRHWSRASRRHCSSPIRISRPSTATRADKDTKVNLTIASKWVGHTFGGLALTLEMPFKDNADRPDPVLGWNGARSRRLGADALTALHAMLPSL